MEQDNNAVKDLVKSIEAIKKEVDALQITVMSQKTPWYRNVSTTIAILALLFSFGTTYVSYKRTEAQDIQSTRVELRGLLQRLAYLPRDSFETSQKYLNDPNAVRNMGGTLIRKILCSQDKRLNLRGNFQETMFPRLNTTLSR